MGGHHPLRAGVAFSLITLPVEFNASRRALTTLSVGGYQDEEEMTGARKVLRAAAMTYVLRLGRDFAAGAILLLAGAGRRRDCGIIGPPRKRAAGFCVAFGASSTVPRAGRHGQRIPGASPPITKSNRSPEMGSDFSE
jgi:hypothetical protein